MKTSAILPVLAASLCATSFALPPAADTSPEKYQKSYELEAQGEYREALSVLATLPSSEKDGYVYKLRKGWLHYLDEDYTPSIAAYEEAVQAAPASVEPRLGLLLPQMAHRRWKDAEKTARDILKIDPLNYSANSRLAYILYNGGKYKDAGQFYERIVHLYPSDLEMRSGLGWSLLKQAKKREAASEFRFILAVAPAHAMANEGLRNTE